MLGFVDSESYIGEILKLIRTFEEESYAYGAAPLSKVIRFGNEKS